MLPTVLEQTRATLPTIWLLELGLDSRAPESLMLLEVAVQLVFDGLDTLACTPAPISTSTWVMLETASEPPPLSLRLVLLVEAEAGGPPGRVIPRKSDLSGEKLSWRVAMAAALG